MHFISAPAIKLSKTVSHLKARPFETLTYQIKYSNSGFSTAYNFEVIEVLPTNTIYITNSAEVSNQPHNGTILIQYSTNYSNGIWLPDSYDTSTNVEKIKRIKYKIQSPINSNQNGVLKFKVIIK